MRLEKATAHSSEAGLAGWISSNDVTLFTMVLVVVIALFLQSNLLKRSKQNAALQKNLDFTSSTLDEKSSALEETKRKRDALDAELAARKADLSQTQATLTLTQTERARLAADLETANKNLDDLRQALNGLTVEKQALTAQKARLETDKSALAKDKSTLNEQLTSLTAQLTEKLKALKDVEEQRALLNKRAADLDAIVTTLEQKLTATNTNLESMRKLSDEEKAKAAERIKQLETVAQTDAARADDYLARLRRAAELFKGMKAEKQTLESQVSGLSQKLTDTQQQYQQVNRELVGLNGGLKRVAFIFDASGSMKEPGTGGEDRWAEALAIAATWLEHLDVDECALIIYSTDVRTFPEDGTLTPIRGEANRANRQKLIEHLKKIEPAGSTNTLDALRAAYKYPQLDSIMLFSDGAPTRGNSGRFDPRLAEEIYALCRQHATIPINSVGLGNYFDQEMGTFLRTVARLTGGTFRGR